MVTVQRKVVMGLAIFSVLLSIFSVIFQFTMLSHVVVHKVEGRVTADISFCINQVPTISYDCATLISEDVSFYCLLNATDLDGTVNVSDTFIAGDRIFNVSPNGTISFTPVNDDVGNYTIRFTATDNSGCENDDATIFVNLEIANVNDAPVLVENIPDATFNSETTLSAFFLTDYFTDPDGDTMNFSSTSPAGISVEIRPTSEVIFRSSDCVPDGELVIFTATDPYNASTDSNAITVRVICVTTSTGGGSGGGGGGGGGGAAFICEPAWECDEWLTCLPTNFQWRRCYDLRGCEPQNYLKRICEYEGPPTVCEENWICSDWSACYVNRTQQRTCEDLSECGTVVTKPPTSQGCVYLPTCFDGMQNGNETGVDCGGGCSACAVVERPALILGDEGIAWWLILLIILAILIMSGVTHYYRAEIVRGVSFLSLALKGKREKDILLDAAQRNALFEKILLFEQKVQTPENAYDGLAAIKRALLHEAIGVPFEVTEEEFTDRVKLLHVNEQTVELLEVQFRHIGLLEERSLEYDPHFVQMLVEQLRTVICFISEYKVPELSRPMEDYAVKESMSFYTQMLVRLINGLRAIQFNQIEHAKKEYVHLLHLYDGLSPEDREELYEQVKWFFDQIKYSSEIVGTHIVKKPRAIV